MNKEQLLVDRRRDIVEICVNNKNYRIHRGRQKIEDIKKLASIPLADVLELLVDGQLVKIEGDAITIKGGEKFVSHPADGAAS